MAEILGVELARPGNWHLSSGKRSFGPNDLRDAADFFQATGGQRVPIGFGHQDSRFDGDPAFGWVSNIRYMEDAEGPVLLGDLVDMDEWLAAAAPARWPNRSIEGFANLDWNGRIYALAVNRLALLGATPPAMPTLRSLSDVRQAIAAAAADSGAEYISASAMGALRPFPPYQVKEAGMVSEYDEFDEDDGAAYASLYPEPVPRPIAAAARIDWATWGYESGRYTRERIAFWRGLIEAENNRIMASGNAPGVGGNSVEATIRSLHPALADLQHMTASAGDDDEIYNEVYGDLDREIERLSPPRAGRGRPVSAAAGIPGYESTTGTTYRPNPHATNPLADELRDLQPATYRAALRDDPNIPTLFESGELPPFTASGIDPELLISLPWQARHPAAETSDRREAMRIFEACSEDPGWAKVEYAGHRGNADYIARISNWAIGRQQYGKSYG